MFSCFDDFSLSSVDQGLRRLIKMAVVGAVFIRLDSVYTFSSLSVSLSFTHTQTHKRTRARVHSQRKGEREGLLALYQRMWHWVHSVNWKPFICTIHHSVDISCLPHFKAASRCSTRTGNYAQCLLTFSTVPFIVLCCVLSLSKSFK